MGKKFSNTSFDREGLSWTIDIYDTSYSGDVTDFEIVADSLEIIYSPDDDNRIAPILTSACNFSMIIDNSILLAFINGLATAQEGKFRVQIKKDGAIYWAGIILTDQLQYEDRAYPFELSISATDGIKRLKDVEYYDNSSDPVPYEGKQTFIDHLLIIIEKIGTSDLLSNDILISGVNWYEANHTSTSIDPLKNTRFDHKTFLKYDSKTGSVQYTNTYAVLRTITENWNARFALSDGSFRIIQINEYETDNFSFYRYNVSGVEQGITTGSVTKFLLNKVFGGVFQFYPGLRKVEMEYIHRLASNLIPDADFIQGHTVSDLDSSGNVQFYLSCTARSFYNAGVISAPVFIQYRFTISLNDGSTTYYLERNADIVDSQIEYGEFSWTTSSSARVDVISGPAVASPSFQYINSALVTIFIDNLPVSGELNIQAQFFKTINLNGSDAGISPTSSTQFIDPYLEVADLSDRSNSKVYAADNATSGYTAQIQMKSLIGDGPNGNAFGHLEVYDGADWQVSSDWGVGSTGGSNEFHQLLVNETLAGQVSPRKRIISAYLGDFDIHESLNVLGVKHIPTQLSIRCLQGEVQGDWVECIRSISDVSPRSSEDFYIPGDRIPGRDDIDDSIDDSIDDPYSDRLQRDGQNEDTPVDIGIRIPPFTVSSDIQLGSVITSIPVTTASNADTLVIGDTIQVIDRYSGQSQTFVVTQNVLEGDTSISIQATTTTIEIRDGSYVTLDSSDLHAKLNKKWYEQIFSNHNSNTCVITENQGDLPNNTPDIQVFINGQRVFGFGVSGSQINLGFTPNNQDIVVCFFA